MMTVRQKQGFVGFSLIGFLAVLALAANLFSHHDARARERQVLHVTLVAKGMVFVREDDPLHDNPTLTLPAGQIVEIELRNEDPGSMHNLVIPELKIETRQLKEGETHRLRLRVPDSGRLTYYCAVHPLMMRGEIVVGK